LLDASSRANLWTARSRSSRAAIGIASPKLKTLFVRLTTDPAISSLLFSGF
jgi:hypothetical protein